MRLHILYIDDSGTPDDPNERCFVLGAVSVFERGLYHHVKAADDCVASFNLGDANDIELHASAMYNGRDGVWIAPNIPAIIRASAARCRT
jgi:hypothetical protein